MQKHATEAAQPSFNPFRYPKNFQMPHRLVRPLFWAGHTPFAFTIVQLLRPRTIVELGTHTGNSYSAFCQAVSSDALPTQCFAIDHWRGDIHTGPYGEEVYESFKAYHDSRYNGFSRLIRQTFDDAVDLFADGAIDLLHHDGFHSYEAVSHDLMTWRPKLSNRGVLLIHDIDIELPGYGAKQAFDELSNAYPTFVFPHSLGLGIVCVGEEVPVPLKPLLNATADDATAIRRLYARLGERLTRRAVGAGQAD